MNDVCEIGLASQIFVAAATLPYQLRVSCQFLSGSILEPGATRLLLATAFIRNTTNL